MPKWADRVAGGGAHRLTPSARPGPTMHTTREYGGGTCALHFNSCSQWPCCPPYLPQPRARRRRRTDPFATYVEVATASVKDGVAALTQYRDASRKENGNLRAEVAREIGRPIASWCWRAGRTRPPSTRTASQPAQRPSATAEDDSQRPV